MDMETKCEGGWSVVEEGTLIMTADEAVTRLASEISTSPLLILIDYEDEEKSAVKDDRDGKRCIQNIVGRLGSFARVADVRLIQRGPPRKSAEDNTRNRTIRIQSDGVETSQRKQHARH